MQYTTYIKQHYDRVEREKQKYKKPLVTISRPRKQAYEVIEAVIGTIIVGTILVASILIG